MWIIHSNQLVSLVLSLIISLAFVKPALGAEATPIAPATDTDTVDVNAVKEKYWARGNETEMGVIQNRQYSKTGKIQFGLMGGLVSSDPFLSIQDVGGNLGYHLTEYISLEVIGYKFMSGPSGALTTFKKYSKATANTNMPISYYGGEAVISLLYGKLSLVGKSIIYYDMHLLAGGGMMNSESGRAAAFAPGIGQRFYLSRYISLRTDYRMIGFKETIVEKEIPTKLGQPLGERLNWSHTFNIGIDFMFGGK